MCSLFTSSTSKPWNSGKIRPNQTDSTVSTGIFCRDTLIGPIPAQGDRANSAGPCTLIPDL